MELETRASKVDKGQAPVVVGAAVRFLVSYSDPILLITLYGALSEIYFARALDHSKATTK